MAANVLKEDLGCCMDGIVDECMRMQAAVCTGVSYVAVELEGKVYFLQMQIALVLVLLIEPPPSYACRGSDS